MDDLKKKRIRMGFDDSQDIVDDLDGEEDEDDLGDDEGDDLNLEDDGDDEDDEDADEDGEGESGHNRSGKGVPTSTFHRVRKREVAERRRRKEVEGENATLLAKLKELEDADSAKPPVSDDEIRSAAADIVAYPPNATEDQKKAILQTAEAQLRKIIGLTLKGVKPPKELSDLTQRLSALQDKEIFNEEWDEFSDSIPGVYPNATPKQLRLARKAMDRLAHAPKFADKEFDYIFYKNKDIFDQIFRKSRSHTFETRDSVRGNDEGDEDDRSNVPVKNLTPKELLKRKKEMDAAATAQEHKDGWNINNPDGSPVN
jgi:hypothetical protein